MLHMSLLVLESYRNGRTQPPCPIRHRKGVGGKGFPKLFDRYTGNSDEVYWRLKKRLLHKPRNVNQCIKAEVGNFYKNVF